MARATLRIYLGAAPGVGKTFAMLNEGWRRLERGTDVVIGIIETHDRRQTADQIRSMEIVPRQSVSYRGSMIEEMDIDAILTRKPQLCLVDELAHTNAPGSRNAKRWRDVEELLHAGIDVISTVNVQHLESLNDVVEKITGVTQRETVPDAVVRSADQIELVDMSPEALRRRMAHGNVYPAERIDAALANYFRPGNLGALRELALLWVADRVEENLNDYLTNHGISKVWETRERIVVAVSSAPSSDNLIRRGARIAQRVRGELVAVHVSPSDGRATSDAVADLEARRRMVEEVGGAYHEIVSDTRATALMSFARSHHATQLLLGASGASSWRRRVVGSFAQQVIGLADGIDVHIVASKEADGQAVSPNKPAVRQRSPLGRRRVVASWLVTLIGVPLVTALLIPFRNSLSLSVILLVLLTLVLSVAAIGGRRASLGAALLAALFENWFFVAPLHTLTVKDPNDAVAIVMFLVVAATAGTLVENASADAVSARTARAEAEALARSTATLAADPEPLAGLLTHLRSTLGLDAAAVLRENGNGTWEPVISSGEPVPAMPEPNASFPLATSETTPDHVLVFSGRKLAADDLRLIAVLADQIAIGIESLRLHDEVHSVHALAEVDATRTALLRAVSHDLRSPLTAIKTFVTGLRSLDVNWSPEQVQESLAAIEDETDRLNRLVGNLLDAGRLEAGMTAVDLDNVDIADVVEAVLHRSPEQVRIDVAKNLPAVCADRALLERCFVNLVENACRHGASNVPVVVDATRVGSDVHIRVADRGPGIPEPDRSTMIEPFHRLGDRNTTGGVGLGLAIVDGFVRAMNGTLTLDDTPGGGLTATIILPLAKTNPPTQIGPTISERP